MIGGSAWAVVWVIPLTSCRSHLVTCPCSTPEAKMADDIPVLSTGPPRCSKHSRLCSLRVVRKDGENKGRHFYTCPLPRETRCDYFQVRIRLQGLISKKCLFLQPPFPSHLWTDISF
uniref:Nei like DNA glycosylase 3 n=1 Tax=Hypotaenidia okinawae TaxID=2861861 RepID=A0A6G1R393_9GRUI